MRILRMEIVVRTVQVRGHPRNGVPVVLNSVGLAHFDASDLGHRVPFVGGLQRAGEQCLFWDRLGCELGVDARGAEEEELLDAVAVGGVNDVGLDLEVDTDELGWIGLVGVDAADLGRGEDDEPGLLGSEEGLDIVLAGEVELGVSAEEEVGEAEVPELADNGGAHEASVSGHKDLGGFVGEEGGDGGRSVGVVSHFRGLNFLPTPGAPTTHSSTVLLCL